MPFTAPYAMRSLPQEITRLATWLQRPQLSLLVFRQVRIVLSRRREDVERQCNFAARDLDEMECIRRDAAYATRPHHMALPVHGKHYVAAQHVDDLLKRMPVRPDFHAWGQFVVDEHD